MASEHLFVPKRSADSLGGSDNGGLGGLRGADTIADVVSTITSVTTDRIFVDTAEISSPDRTGSWIVFLDTNLNEVRRVVAFDDTTGTFELDRSLPSTPSVSDRYHLFIPNSLFSSFGGDDCRSRDPRHRLVFAHNLTGGNLEACQAWVVPIVEGPLECRIAMGIVNFSQSSSFDVTDLADENEVPPLDNASGFLKIGASSPPQTFLRPVDENGAYALPYGSRGATGQTTINDTRERPIWIQLSFPTDAPIPRATQAVYQVFIDTAAGATRSSFLVVVDVDGVTELIDAIVDRRLRIGGGARVRALVRDSEAPFEAVPGATIDIELQSGPGSMAPVQDQRVQEGSEPVRRVYLSSEDPADVGATVQFRVEVN